MAGCNGSRCCAISRIITSGLGIFAGLSAATMFFFHYGALQASVWALISAVFATAAMHFAVILNRETIQDWYSAGQLESIKLFAFICFDISTAAFIWYIFYAVYYSIPMMPADQSAYITSVWAFMTAKWTLMLFLFAQKAKRVVQEYLPINGF